MPGTLTHKDLCPKIASRTAWLRNRGPDIIAKEMPLNSPELNPFDYHIWVNVRGLLQAPSETKDNRRIQADSLTRGPIDKAAQEFKSD